MGKRLQVVKMTSPDFSAMMDVWLTNDFFDKIIAASFACLFYHNGCHLQCCAFFRLKKGSSFVLTNTTKSHHEH